MKKLILNLGGRGWNFPACVVALVVCAMVMPEGARGEDLAAMSLEALEARVQEIQRELGELALEKVVGGIGSVGFETRLQSDGRRTEWVEVDWGKPVPIDEIVLAPLLWGLEKGGFTGDGFPLEFRVLAGSPGDATGTVIATFMEKDGHLPRSAPLVIPCRMTASWVRVEATRLSQRIYDRHYNMQFSELMVFSGEENVALKQVVKSSSVGTQEGGRRARSQLTDGFLPYEMSVPAAKSSGGFMADQLVGKQSSLVVDLGQSTPINRIHLHPIECSNTYPADVTVGFGLPDQFTVEGANREDFSDAVKLAEQQRSTPFDIGPLFMARFPEAAYRYVRIQAPPPKLHPEVLGFSEIEIFSKGQNVALGKKVIFSEDLVKNNPGSVNDGLNRYGRIIPLKQWIGELARRHDLQNELPLVRQEIQRRYDQQKQQRTVLAWFGGLALAGGLLGMLAVKIRNMREIGKLRERFAADLHDELGASLRSIGMLTEMAREDLAASKTLGGILDQIQGTTASTLDAMRQRIKMQLHPVAQDISGEMRRLSKRLLPDIHWNLEIQGEEHLSALKPLLADDLVLFYKECLVNISRHSKATQVGVALRATAKQLDLEVADNGQGLAGGPPPSLQRRARLLGGTLAAIPSPAGGTTITLTLRF